jgi:uncharacterized DUF497 family protein
MASWNEHKRRKNIQRHGLNFEGAEAIWDNFTVTREDTREDYGETRLVTFGILNGEVVVLVHVDRDDDMHIISLRKAEKYEARYYFETAETYFRQDH